MKVLVTGNNGYVGSKLVPTLVAKGHEVIGLDLLNGTDIRKWEDVVEAIEGCEAVIHLACVSNDPSFDLDPALGKSINYDCFPMLVEEAKKAGVRRFIYASSSSVYGVKEEKDVTEDLSLQPLTDYSKYKAACERILLQEKGDMEAVIVRPATICGYSPNMRLDLLVHILTRDAVKKGKINVHGGHQYRPNIHIDDMVNCYLRLLEAPATLVDGEIFNTGYLNMTILETAQLVQSIVGDVVIHMTESTDPRSYHVNSDKIKRVLGFEPRSTIEDAIIDIAEALMDGRISNPDDDKYYRNRTIKKLVLAA